jgi:multidrug resistance efflux pump
MKRKRLLILILIAGLAAGAYFLDHSNHTAMVLTGVVTTDDVLVSPQIAGKIVKLTVSEGDVVKRGQLLALIDTRELAADRAYYTHSTQSYSDQVSAAEATLRYQELQTRDQIREAQAAVASAESQQRQAEATLQQANSDLRRNGGLYEQGIISSQAYDQARTNQATAQAAVDALRKQVDVQRALLSLAESNAQQVTVRRSQLDANKRQLAAAAAQQQKAEVRLNYTQVRSPIDGVVESRAALEGEMVNAGQTIVSLINPDDLWVRADIEETYIDGIRDGDKLVVRFPSGMERTGTVYYRAVDADYATQRDVSRTKRDIKTFEIRLRVDNTDRRLRPGLTAYVTVPQDKAITAARR